MSDVHKEGCKLKWNKPKDDGGLPIKQYEIEKLDKETGRWTRCGKTDKPEFEVTGLTPGKEYLFRVVATNDEGESEPLETLEAIVAKNPYGMHQLENVIKLQYISNISQWSGPISESTKYPLCQKKMHNSTTL